MLRAILQWEDTRGSYQTPPGARPGLWCIGPLTGTLAELPQGTEGGPATLASVLDSRQPPPSGRPSVPTRWPSVPSGWPSEPTGWPSVPVWSALCAHGVAFCARGVALCARGVSLSSYRLLAGRGLLPDGPHHTAPYLLSTWQQGL